MANIKNIIIDIETDITIYAMIRRESDKYLYDNTDGTFKASSITPYAVFDENTIIKGRYEFEDNRAIWTDGKYTAAIYRQNGITPSPVDDLIVGSGNMVLLNDIEVDSDSKSVLDEILPIIKRIAGLSLENYRLYDVTYYGNDLTGAKIATFETLSDYNANIVMALYQIIATYNTNRNLTEYVVKKIG